MNRGYNRRGREKNNFKWLKNCPHEIQDKIAFWSIKIYLEEDELLENLAEDFIDGYERNEKFFNPLANSEKDEKSQSKLFSFFGITKSIQKLVSPLICEYNNFDYRDKEKENFKKKILTKIENEMITILEDRANELQKKISQQKSNHSILSKNIEKIANLTNLNKEEIKILEFICCKEYYSFLKDLFEDTFKIENETAFICDFLNINSSKDYFDEDSPLVKSGLIDFHHHRSDIIINDRLIEKLNYKEADIETIFEDRVAKCQAGSLSLKDFNHLENKLNIVLPYLKNAIANCEKGVNVFFYGVPGTGKTELAKAIATKLKTELFEVSSNKEKYFNKNGRASRLTYYKNAQALFSHKKNLLMFDEVEDIFGEIRYYKGYFNKTLENNPIPTIWISNSIHIDPAFIRRFDLVFEIGIPPRTKRKEILQKFSKNFISEEVIQKISANQKIAPALVSRAAKVVKSIEKQQKENSITLPEKKYLEKNKKISLEKSSLKKNYTKQHKEDKEKIISKRNENFEFILNNTLKAQGHKSFSFVDLPKSYSLDFINCDKDLKKILVGIKKSQNARICLYGPTGTGKSAYGKYIAKQLDKNFIIKKVSDLQSMWLGETEKNIANAFEQATEEKAVLIFDEVDSFLGSREKAQRSWELSQVNEMLVQMENFNGIFIATTNLMANLDKASLRRFDLKMKFDFLKPCQSWQLFNKECILLKIKITNQKKLKQKINNLEFLTPGDFAAVLRQNTFNAIENSLDFIERLADEVKVKGFGDENLKDYVL